MAHCLCRLLLVLAHHVAVAQLPPPPPEVLANMDHEIGLVAAGIDVAVPKALSLMETPITARIASSICVGQWNCVAVYSSMYLDAITGQRPAVSVPDASMHLTRLRAECGAHFFVAMSEFAMPAAAVDGMVETYTGKVSDIATGTDSAVAACHWEDAACLRAAAAAANYSPRVMAHVVMAQLKGYLLADGWNHDGSAACTAHCRPYMDYTGYMPNPAPDRWQPLVEDNGKGFFFKTEHVSPYIGTHAKLRVLTRAQCRQRQAPRPRYSATRFTESREVIKRMRSLNDTLKMEVEVMDSKILVADYVIAAFLELATRDLKEDAELPSQAGKKLSYERFLNFLVGRNNAEYDSIVVAWREKRRWDLVRPTTVIRRWKGKIETWRPGGVAQFDAADFHAYQRVMPHSEYPSGSASICTAGADYVQAYLQKLGLGSDMPVMGFPIPAGSSRNEPGMTPATDLQLKYSSMAELAHRCGQSRLDGGMHFPESVVVGEQIGEGIGTLGVEWAIGLLGSGSPAAQDTCGPL